MKRLLLFLVLTFTFAATPAGPPGLPNVGNTCYMNGGLQVFYNMKEFVDFLITHKKTFKEDLLVNGLINLLEAMKSNEKDLIKKTLVDVNKQSCITMKVKEGGQQDSSEFYNNVLDAIRDVIKSQKDLIKQEFNNQVVVKQCDRIKAKIENKSKTTASNSHFYLSLPVKGWSFSASNLHDCLNEYFKVESIDDFKWNDNDTIVTPIYKNIVLKSTPNYLSLGLKRYDNITLKKLVTAVSIPEFLDMRPYMDSEILKNSKDTHQFAYELIGATIHIGGAGGGHYYAYVRDKSKWYLCDDSSVKQQDSFASIQSDINTGYTFVYKRMEKKVGIKFIEQRDKEIAKKAAEEKERQAQQAVADLASALKSLASKESK